MTDIIIPVHNRLEHTKQTLMSLFKNTEPYLFKLYVIDDVSDDGTREWLIDLLKERGDFTLILNEKCIGPAACRNKVCNLITEKEDRGVYLYFSDNDVYFKEGWLSILIKTYTVVNDLGDEKGVFRLLGGGCHAYLQNRGTVKIEDPIGNLNIKVGIKDAVSGYSQLLTWETWDQFGNLSESVRDSENKIADSSDWEWCQRITRFGFLVGSIEPEVVLHTGRTNTYGKNATGSETIKDVEGVFVQ